ncbi:HMG high mobility group box-containing protein [Nitzschia inconspicua]|uniref:HMG high mobility group box-containing protein n=1 Tax=Nitzschia inconspicua TaxID=303405 RepID=A0A9K3KWP4_9STRA|nr:HMG high mobility group box-containing protein [Nitzschia inconspicua]
MDGINRDGKSDEKIPAAAGKVPRKKGRKVKPKGTSHELLVSPANQLMTHISRLIWTYISTGKYFASGFPKRPLSAYNWFFKEERKKVLNLDFQSMGREISARWRNTTPEQREQFEELAKVDTERYKKEVQIYEEEQILKAKKERELAERKRTSEEMGSYSTGFEDPALFDNSAASLLDAATFRNKEEKNRPDAPWRMSQRFASFPASMEPNVTDIEMVRRRQLNQMLLTNGIQPMQNEAYRNQAPLGTVAHSQANFFAEQANNAMILEQLRQREEFALAAVLYQQQGNSEFIGGNGILNDILLLRQQQQVASNVQLGVPNFSFVSDIERAMRERYHPVQLPSPTIMHLRTALHQTLPSSRQPRDQDESSAESFNRRIHGTLLARDVQLARPINTTANWKQWPQRSHDLHEFLE